ncbi:MAG: hypothetical protein LBT08_11460, partial [Synergistaceae bacterium]|nr:hypothetical protein [Synergistaceae bacterium]
MSLLKQSFMTKLKQMWFPKEFRLPEPEFSREQIDLLEELIQLLHPTLSRVEMAGRDDKVQMSRFLVELGTGLWRIRRKIEGLSRMPKEIRDALFSLESTWLSLSDGGVEIVDHVGTVPSGNEARIVEVRDIPNLPREQVVETLKPTIILKGEVIQVGEVVMGRPAANGSEARKAQEKGGTAIREDEDDAPTVTHEVETLTMDPPLNGHKFEEPETEEPQEIQEETESVDETEPVEPQEIQEEIESVDETEPAESQEIQEETESVDETEPAEPQEMPEEIESIGETEPVESPETPEEIKSVDEPEPVELPEPPEKPRRRGGRPSKAERAAAEAALLAGDDEPASVPETEPEPEKPKTG